MAQIGCFVPGKQYDSECVEGMYDLYNTYMGYRLATVVGQQLPLVMVGMIGAVYICESINRVIRVHMKEATDAWHGRKE